MTLPQSGHRFHAGVFDMDGVLLDSEPLHHQAVNEILRDAGHEALSLEQYTPYMGTTDEYTWNDLINRFRLEESAAHYRERYDTRILDLYRTSSVAAPGAGWLLAGLRQRGIRLAIASSSKLLWVETCLLAMNLRAYFDELATGDMVGRTKPDPAIYLLAAQRLGVDPAQCFAIEDSPKGVAAARAAGMYTIAVTTPYTMEADTSDAQVRLPSLAAFDFALVDDANAEPSESMRSV